MDDKSSEKDLGELHGILAKTLKAKIECNGSNNLDIKSLIEELPFDEIPKKPARAN